MKWTEADYAYPRFHSRKATHRLKRGDKVRIERGKVSLEGLQQGNHVPVGKWKSLGVGTFLGCDSRQNQMPVFQLPNGKLIGGCECWWIRLDAAEQVERKVLVDEMVQAVEAMSTSLSIRPMHVLASGDFETLVEWKRKMPHDGVWYSLFLAPHLGKVNPKFTRELATALKVPMCQRRTCRHVRG